MILVLKLILVVYERFYLPVNPVLALAYVGSTAVRKAHKDSEYTAVIAVMH